MWIYQAVTNVGVQVLGLMALGWLFAKFKLLEQAKFLPQSNFIVLLLALPAFNLYLMGIKLDLQNAEPWKSLAAFLLWVATTQAAILLYTWWLSGGDAGEAAVINMVLLMDNFGIVGLLALNATLGTKWGTLALLMSMGFFLTIFPFSLTAFEWEKWAVQQLVECTAAAAALDVEAATKAAAEAEAAEAAEAADGTTDKPNGPPPPSSAALPPAPPGLPSASLSSDDGTQLQRQDADVGDGGGDGGGGGGGGSGGGTTAPQSYDTAQRQGPGEPAAPAVGMSAVAEEGSEGDGGGGADGFPHQYRYCWWSNADYQPLKKGPHVPTASGRGGAGGGGGGNTVDDELMLPPPPLPPQASSIQQPQLPSPQLPSPQLPSPQRQPWLAWHRQRPPPSQPPPPPPEQELRGTHVPSPLLLQQEAAPASASAPPPETGAAADGAPSSGPGAVISPFQASAVAAWPEAAAVPPSPRPPPSLAAPSAPSAIPRPLRPLPPQQPSSPTVVRRPYTVGAGPLSRAGSAAAANGILPSGLSRVSGVNAAAGEALTANRTASIFERLALAGSGALPPGLFGESSGPAGGTQMAGGIPGVSAGGRISNGGGMGTTPRGGEKPVSMQGLEFALTHQLSGGTAKQLARMSRGFSAAASAATAAAASPDPGLRRMLLAAAAGGAGSGPQQPASPSAALAAAPPSTAADLPAGEVVGAPTAAVTATAGPLSAPPAVAPLGRLTAASPFATASAAGALAAGGTTPAGGPSASSAAAAAPLAIPAAFPPPAADTAADIVAGAAATRRPSLPPAAGRLASTSTPIYSCRTAAGGGGGGAGGEIALTPATSYGAVRRLDSVPRQRRRWTALASLVSEGGGLGRRWRRGGGGGGGATSGRGGGVASETETEQRDDRLLLMLASGLQPFENGWEGKSSADARSALLRLTTAATAQLDAAAVGDGGGDADEAERQLVRAATAEALRRHGGLAGAFRAFVRGHPQLWHILAILAKNPMIWTMFIAMAVSVTGLRRFLDPASPHFRPELGWVAGVLAWINGLVVPLSIFANGVWLYGKRWLPRGEERKLVVLLLLKAGLLPLLMLGCGLLVRLDGQHVAALTLLTLSPAAAVSFVLAVQYGRGVELVSLTNILGTLFMTPLLVAWIKILAAMNIDFKMHDDG